MYYAIPKGADILSFKESMSAADVINNLKEKGKDDG